MHSMTTKTVGFAIEEADSNRLEQLVKKYGGGNRSAFLRAAMDYMETVDRAERLGRLQSYGAARSAARELTLADVQKIVRRVLRSKSGT